MTHETIYEAIRQERKRQNEIHIWSEKTNKLAVLVEEIGEIASAMQGDGDLQEELIQLASVCVRWLEDI